MKANILNPEHVAATISGAEAVINLVGILRQSGRQRFGRLHRDVPGEIAKAALEAGASTFVHVSSLGVSPNSPSIYARTKAEGEMRVRDAFPAATILRPSLLFGPEDNFFNRFADMARFSPFLPLIGGGKTKFQPVYVGDVAAAIAKAVMDPSSTRGRTYELGGPTVYTFKELMEIILRETCRKRALLPIPFALASIGAAVANLSPWPPITPDQVRLLKTDNVMTKGALGLGDSVLSRIRSKPSCPAICGASVRKDSFRSYGPRASPSRSLAHSRRNHRIRIPIGAERRPDFCARRSIPVKVAESIYDSITAYYFSLISSRHKIP